MLITIHPDNPDKRKIKTVVECLLDGGVIIYPTDTVYSFGCSLIKNRGIERIAKIKKIKPEKANFSVVCHDLSSLSEYAKVDTPIFKILKKSLPGPYTFILNASNKVPKLFSSNKKSIGLRVPDHPICHALILGTDQPLIASSVHDDDEILEYTTDPIVIHDNFQHVVDIVIDGGYGHNVASTIIDCTSGAPELVRQGMGETEHLF